MNYVVHLLKLHRGLGFISTDDEEREQDGEETATKNKKDTKRVKQQLFRSHINAISYNLTASFWTVGVKCKLHTEKAQTPLLAMEPRTFLL